MNIKIVILMAGLLLLACSSAKKTEIYPDDVIIEPQVRHFLDNTKNSDEKLAVTVRSKMEIDDIAYLHKINKTYYTANVTAQQLIQLLSDKRIEKISSSIKKPLK